MSRAELVSICWELKIECKDKSIDEMKQLICKSGTLSCADVENVTLIRAQSERGIMEQKLQEIIERLGGNYKWK